MIHETLQSRRSTAEAGHQRRGRGCRQYQTPLDLDTLRASVGKTGRAVIVHEAARSGGVGAEIAADLSEHCAPG